MKKPEKYVEDVVAIANIQEITRGVLTSVGLEVLPPLEEGKVNEIVSKVVQKEVV